jgi:hypothetical protein
MRWALSAVMVTLIASSNGYARDYEACVNNPQLIGACWTTRGRIGLYNGNPSVRIWPVRSNRLLGVRESDAPETPLMPPELAARFDWNTYIFGDLKVCPLTKTRPRAMQIVCVASAENIVTRAR